jgi:dTDP-4-dehydrorhamnose 3,5-epimerase (EC 5.1.3.13)
MPFKSFKKLEIPDVMLIEFIRFPDERGFFAELYKRTDFLANGVPYDFVQVNLSFSRKGVVRGLHYQLRPMEQGKLVYVISGRVYDVAVDIRKGSPWFGKYVGLSRAGVCLVDTARLCSRLSSARRHLLPIFSYKGVRTAAREMY